MVALRRPGLATFLLVGVLILVPTTRGTAATATEEIAGNVEPVLDAVQSGTVGVAASGAPVGGVVSVVVRNATRRAVTRLRISARAIDDDGRTVARTTTRSVIPDVLERDALGLARVDFGDPALPLHLSFEFDVASTRARRAPSTTLEPLTFRLSAPTTGPVAQTLDITLRNPADTRARGPVRVAVMCFGESRRPVQYFGAKTRIEPLAAGASFTATVAFDALCPAYLVGATAASTR